MTASGEANMEIRDAMLTQPTNSCRAGCSKKAMLACAMTANTKASSTRSPTIFSCGRGGETRSSPAEMEKETSFRRQSCWARHLTRVLLLSA